MQVAHRGVLKGGQVGGSQSIPAWPGMLPLPLVAWHAMLPPTFQPDQISNDLVC